MLSMLKRARRQRNPGVVYSGVVGANMKPPKWRVRRILRSLMRACKLRDGPWRGHTLYLDPNSGSSTLPITINGQAGRYVDGRWRKHESFDVYH